MRPGGLGLEYPYCLPTGRQALRLGWLANLASLLIAPHPPCKDIFIKRITRTASSGRSTGCLSSSGYSFYEDQTHTIRHQRYLYLLLAKRNTVRKLVLVVKATRKITFEQLAYFKNSLSHALNHLFLTK